MLLKILTLTTTLTTLLTQTTCIPLSPSSSSPSSPSSSSTPSSTLDTPDGLSSAIAQIIVDETIADSNNSTCPPSNRSKQCCESINDIASQITQPLGMLIPWIGGVDISSVLGLDCTGMSDDTPNDQCSHQVMCCDGQPNSEGSSQPISSACKPFDDAIKDKNDAINDS